MSSVTRGSRIMEDLELQRNLRIYTKVKNARAAMEQNILTDFYEEDEDDVVIVKQSPLTNDLEIEEKKK